MIRHISVYTFLDTPDKQKNMETVREYLEKVPQLYPAIKSQYVRVGLGTAPVLPDDAPVLFGDMVQVIDYETLEDANGYPPSKAHMDLVEFSSPMLKKVTTIDYEM